MKNTLICILCMGFATVTLLLLSKNIGYDILNDKSLTDVCSLVFTNICKRKVPFQVYTAVQNVKYSEMWKKMKTLLTWYSIVHALVHEEFDRLCVPLMRVWRTLHAEGMYPHHIQGIQHLEPADMCSRLELCHWINYNPHMTLNILFTDEAHFIHEGVNKTRNFHLWDRNNPHGTVESNFQHLFAINVWCGVIGLYIFL